MQVKNAQFHGYDHYNKTQILTGQCGSKRCKKKKKLHEGCNRVQRIHLKRLAQFTRMERRLSQRGSVSQYNCYNILQMVRSLMSNIISGTFFLFLFFSVLVDHSQICMFGQHSRGSMPCVPSKGDVSGQSDRSSSPGGGVT